MTKTAFRFQLSSALLLGCSAGAVATIPAQDAGSGSSSSSGSTSSSGGSSGTPCPAATPTTGSACPKKGLICEFGDANCRERATCESTEKWDVVAPRCPDPDPMNQCPSSYASVPKGMTCTANGVECRYPEGICACAGPPSPVPMPGEPTTWRCDQPAEGCPPTPPLLGTACSNEGLRCAYGECIRSTGRSATCKDGMWVDQGFGCPVH